MNFIDKLRKSLTDIKDGEDDLDFEYDLVDAQEPEEEIKSAAKSGTKPGTRRVSFDDFTYDTDNIKQVKPDVANEVILAQLRSIDDAPDVVNNLRVNRVCIVNLEGVEVETAQRIADFLGGASFAMNGSIERVNESIFVMAPLGTSINDLLKRCDKSSSGIFSWVSKAARF